MLPASTPSSAHATADLNAAVRVANAVFPQVGQRCGTVRVEIGPLSLSNILASAESFFGQCKIRYAPKTFEFATQAQLCSLSVHEWGHLAGLGHSSDPNDFMYPTVPHNPACGESDQARAAREMAAAERRRATISRKLSKLRRSLRATRRAQRKAHGALKTRLAGKARRLRTQIRKLRYEYNSLPMPALYAAHVHHR